MGAAPQVEAAPVGLEVHPLPVATEVQQVQLPDGMRVVLMVKTPQGISGYFFSAEHARTLAAQLAELAGASEAGLFVAGG